MSDEINRNQPLERHTLIDEEKSIKAAFSKGTWFVTGEDGEDVVEEPIPESIKATGKIPEGYALGEFKLLVYVFRFFLHNDWGARSYLGPINGHCCLGQK